VDYIIWGNLKGRGEWGKGDKDKNWEDGKGDRDSFWPGRGGE